jgi:hypothetical protein
VVNSGFIFIQNILFFQDWQEILSLYEKDNAYLGKEQNRHLTETDLITTRMQGCFKPSIEYERCVVCASA